MGICIHPRTKDVYITQFGSNKIKKFSQGVVSTFAGTYSPGCTDGPVNIASFNRPYDVKIDLRDDSLIISDYLNQKLRKITKEGIVSTITWLNDKGEMDSRVVSPTCLSIDQQNNVCYIAQVNSEGSKIARIYLPSVL